MLHVSYFVHHLFCNPHTHQKFLLLSSPYLLYWHTLCGFTIYLPFHSCCLLAYTLFTSLGPMCIKYLTQRYRLIAPLALYTELRIMVDWVSVGRFPLMLCQFLLSWMPLGGYNILYIMCTTYYKCLPIKYCSIPFHLDSLCPRVSWFIWIVPSTIHPSCPKPFHLCLLSKSFFLYCLPCQISTMVLCPLKYYSPNPLSEFSILEIRLIRN